MLSRNELINIMKESETKISRDNIDLDVIKSVLESILEKLNSVKCISDLRFIPYGRMETLEEEFYKNINEKKYIDAYFNISDFLSDSRISLNSSPEIVDKNKEYYNEDNICKEEKEMLIKMINKCLSSINNNGKKGNNVNKQDILKEICDGLNESIDNFEISRLEEINADIFTLKDNQRGLGGIIIGDDGSSIVCGSIYPISHYIEEFKNSSIQNPSTNSIPDNLKDFITFDDDGYVLAKQKLPVELESNYNNFIENYYSNDNKIVNNIVNKIIELPYNTETTIAQLINYNPEVAFVSPMTQGIISNAVRNKCRSNNIELEESDDSLGGLAYYVKFKKIQSNKSNVLNDSIQENNIIDAPSPNNQKQYVYSDKEYRELFEQDENRAYIRLIIPKDDYTGEDELNLIGKLPQDYSLDEIIRMKTYSSNIFDHIIDPNDIDSTVEVLVNVIDELPKGTEISISQILGNHLEDYETKELFKINQDVIKICREKGINLNFDKYKDRVVGLPYSIPFIKE